MFFRGLSVLFLVVFGLFSCSKTDLNNDEDYSVVETSEFYYSNEVTTDNSVIELDILQLINDYRISNGLSELLPNSSIKIQAEQHSLYMTHEDVMSHDLFYIRNSNIRKSIASTTVKENVGYGYNTALGLVNAWKNSPSHKAVLDDVNVTYFNVSARKKADNTYYFTLMCSN